MSTVPERSPPPRSRRWMFTPRPSAAAFRFASASSGCHRASAVATIRSSWAPETAWVNPFTWTSTCSAPSSHRVIVASATRLARHHGHRPEITASHRRGNR